MPPYHATLAEQETVIRWDREDPVVHLWSASPITWRKLAKLGVAPIRETRVGGVPSGKFYTIPLSEFRWRLKRAHDPARPVPRRPRSLQESRSQGDSGPSEPSARLVGDAGVGP